MQNVDFIRTYRDFLRKMFSPENHFPFSQKKNERNVRLMAIFSSNPRKYPANLNRILSFFFLPKFLGSIYMFILHSVFSIFDSFYLPFAIVYFVGRIYSGCLSNEACSYVSVRDYLTPEILIIAASCCLQIPTLTLIIQLLEYWRSFTKVRKLTRRRRITNLCRHLPTYLMKISKTIGTKLGGCRIKI